MAASPFFNETHYCYYLCPSNCPLVCFPLPPGLGFPNPPPPPSHSNQNNSHVIIIVAVLVSVFLLLCFCSALVKQSYDRNISRRSTVPTNTDEDHDQIRDPATDTRCTRTAGVEDSLINSITVCKYKKGEGLIEGTECSVCLSEFSDNENLRLLPNCNHAFHLPCIDTWLKSQTNCPLCRASVVSNSIISSAMDPSSVSSQPAAESHQMRDSQSHIGLGSNQSNGGVGN